MLFIIKRLFFVRFNTLFLESDCFTGKGEDYTGNVSVTSSGLHCQEWNSQLPHKHVYTDIRFFPDLERRQLRNHCRNPNGISTSPWCYTSSVSKVWEHCNIPICGKPYVSLHTSLISCSDSPH